MRHLLYCIFRKGAAPRPAACSGKGPPPSICPPVPPPGVFVIGARGLAAAASLWSDERTRVDLAGLRAYEEIVAAFHASRTIIPLRFGCVLQDRSRVMDLLAQHRAEYRRLLDDLEGHVEMGLRMLWNPGPEGARRPGAGGHYYLELARRRQIGLTAGEERWTERVCGQLSGLYARTRREARPAPGGRLVSLYFLVPGDGVETFRKRVRHLAVTRNMKLLSSGPWPPYNFVDHAGE